MRTFQPKPGQVTRQWHVIDATDVVLGRLASQTARLLRGKHKPIFAPHLDTGDFVIIVNASKVALTGNKRVGKLAHRHSGFPGGLTSTPIGELLDKVAILQIKSERMKDAAKLANVRKELSALEQTWMEHPAAGKDIVELRAALKAVNERLWVIEDDIRVQESQQRFDEEFVRLARAVYHENDERAQPAQGSRSGALPP